MFEDIVYEPTIGTFRDEGFIGRFQVFARGGDDELFIPDSSLPGPDEGNFVLLKGQAGDDLIIVDKFKDLDSTHLYGGAGDDDIHSVGGFVSGGAGRDVLINTRDDPGLPNATLRGGAGVDELKVVATFGSGTDVLRGGGDSGDFFDFDIAAGHGHARLVLGDGADDIRGRGRATILHFDVDHDRFIVDANLNGGPERIRQTVIGEGEDAYLRIRYIDPNGQDERPTILTVIGQDTKLPDSVFRFPIG